MANFSLNGPASMPRDNIGTYIYTGTDKIQEGEPFVLDMDEGKQNYIKRPTASGGVFAGVAVRSYPSDDGARQVDLAIPGSCGVNVRIDATVTKGKILAFAHAGGGGKVFKAATVETTLAKVAAGNAITRKELTVEAGAALVPADLPIGPYSDGVAGA